MNKFAQYKFIIIMGFSPVLRSSSWVSQVKSQLLPAAQRCKTFLRIYAVANKADICASNNIRDTHRIRAILQNL